jgi:GT2 family glycosyltransferase
MAERVLLIGSDSSETIPGHLTTSHLSLVPAAPDLSVVVVVWNALDYAKRCIDSVLAARDTLVTEIVVVDNGSDIGVLEWLNEQMTKQPSIRFVRLPSNVGYARGVNIGVGLSRGRYVCLLNSDTVVTQGWAEKLVEALTETDSLGIVSPVTNYVGEGLQIDDQARDIPLEDIDRYADSIANRPGHIRVPERLAFFCVMLRRSLFDRLNGLYEGFTFGNFEDEDFCTRTQLLGFDVAVVPASFVYHHGGATFSENRVDHSDWMVRNTDVRLERLTRFATSKSSSARLIRTGRPEVSVVVRTQSRPQGLRAALRSLANQTNPDFEVVIVNDGGAAVESVAAEFEERFDINIVNNDAPHGQAAALNDGLNQCRHKFVSFLDDDDIVYPFHLDLLLDGAANGTCESRSLWYSHYSRALMSELGDGAVILARTQPPVWEFSPDELLVQNFPPIHTWLVARGLFERTGGFREDVEVLSDWDFLLRASEATSFKSIPRVSCEYRLYLTMTNSVTRGRRRVRRDMEGIYERYPVKTPEIVRRRSVEMQALQRQIDACEDLLARVASGEVGNEEGNLRLLGWVGGFEVEHLLGSPEFLASVKADGSGG